MTENIQRPERRESLRKRHVVILEDNARRLAEMLLVLNETCPHVGFDSYDNAPDFIARTRPLLMNVNLLCLDHDLDPPAHDPRRPMGDGRDVVHWLLSQVVKVPVLIHTSNSRYGADMEQMLKEAGWKVHWTPPYDDLAWVRRAWIRRVQFMMDQTSESEPHRS